MYLWNVHNRNEKSLKVVTTKNQHNTKEGSQSEREGQKNPQDKDNKRQ